MIFKNVLIAYDTSDSSKKALDMAIEMAKENPETELEIVQVMEIPPSYNPRMPHFLEFEEHLYDEAMEKLSKAGEALKELPNPSKTTLLKGGSPSYAILKHAKDGPYDLIIMGNRGLSAIGELLGGVSHTIVQKAKIPVLIIK